MSESGNNKENSATIANGCGFGGCAVGILIGIWPLIMAGGSMSEAGPGAALWLLPMSLISGGLLGIASLIIANWIRNNS
jgi:hypothetical protein